MDSVDTLQRSLSDGHPKSKNTYIYTQFRAYFGLKRGRTKKVSTLSTLSTFVHVVHVSPESLPLQGATNATPYRIPSPSPKSCSTTPRRHHPTGPGRTRHPTLDRRRLPPKGEADNDGAAVVTANERRWQRSRCHSSRLAPRPGKWLRAVTPEKRLRQICHNRSTPQRSQRPRSSERH